jgi:hypothetical protein
LKIVQGADHVLGNINDRIEQTEGLFIAAVLWARQIIKHYERRPWVPISEGVPRLVSSLRILSPVLFGKNSFRGRVRFLSPAVTWGDVLEQSAAHHRNSVVLRRSSGKSSMRSFRLILQRCAWGTYGFSVRHINYKRLLFDIDGQSGWRHNDVRTGRRMTSGIYPARRRRMKVETSPPVRQLGSRWP